MMYGAKDCTPEINTSEIIVNRQWDFPMDFQLHCPTQFHLSVVCSKGLSFCPVDFHWNCPMDFHWRFPMDFHFCDFW